MRLAKLTEGFSLYLSNWVESYPLRPVVQSEEKYFNLMENLTLFIEKVAI